MRSESIDYKTVAALQRNQFITTTFPLLNYRVEAALIFLELLLIF